MRFTKPKGTSDFYGDNIREWQAIEGMIRQMCAEFSIGEIRTPMYENVDLFKRGVGETTDIVEKEMFVFNDAGGRTFALRPEGTANVARAFIENGMGALPRPVKMYYIMPVFRAEKPQKGRFRQHHQFGVEYLGAGESACDAEVISVAAELLRRVGIKGARPQINSLGCVDCRARYNQALTAFLGDNLDKLCQTCAARFGKNPLRVLDCKNASCRELMGGAPLPMDVLDEECRAHFDDVVRELKILGIEYDLAPRLVRGLDYYTRTVFEFISADLGAQDALLGGGRYDGLMESCGGAATPAVGFGMGLERLLIILGEQGINLARGDARPVFAGYMGERGREAAVRLVQDLRRRGVPAAVDLMGRSVKAQMTYADKIGALYSLVLGDDEIDGGAVKVKNMDSGESAVRRIDDLAEFFISEVNNE